MFVGSRWQLLPEKSFLKVEIERCEVETTVGFLCAKDVNVAVLEYFTAESVPAQLSEVGDQDGHHGISLINRYHSRGNNEAEVAHLLIHYINKHTTGNNEAEVAHSGTVII